MVSTPTHIFQGRFIEEVDMAKRRNLKKEKALRNQAYARKYRKRSSNRYGRRFFNNNRNENESENTDKSTDENKSEDTATAATE